MYIHICSFLLDFLAEDPLSHDLTGTAYYTTIGWAWLHGTLPPQDTFTWVDDSLIVDGLLPASPASVLRIVFRASVWSTSLTLIAWESCRKSAITNDEYKANFMFII